MGFFGKLFRGPEIDMEKSAANREKMRALFNQVVENGDSYRLIFGYTEDVSRFNYGFVHGSKTKIGNLIVGWNEDSQAEALKIKKEDAPAEVEGQLDPKEQQAPGAARGGRREIDPRRTHPHEHEQDAPHNGEHQGGRGQGRLNDGLGIQLDAIPGQPTGECAHSFGEQDEQSINFPGTMFHTSSPASRVCRPKPGYADLGTCVEKQPK